MKRQSVDVFEELTDSDLMSSVGASTPSISMNSPDWVSEQPYS